MGRRELVRGRGRFAEDTHKSVDINNRGGVVCLVRSGRVPVQMIIHWDRSGQVNGFKERALPASLPFEVCDAFVVWFFQ
jgi:hypothetical protein